MFKVVLTCNSFVFSFIVSSNSQISILGVIKLFIERKSNKYLNDK